MKKLNTQGFTLIELMIASVIFATLLLFSTAIIIQIGRLYQRGLTTTRTQETVRRVTDDISGAIQFSGDKVSVIGPVVVGDTSGFQANAYAFCTGNIRYSYVIGAQVSDNADEGKYNTNVAQPKLNLIKHGLWRERITTSNGCTPSDLTRAVPDNDAGGVGSEGAELLSKGTRLAGLQIVPLDDKGKLWSIKVRLAKGDNDLLDDKLDATGNPVPPATADNIKDTCKTGIAGKEFCAIAELNLNVVRRLD